MSKERGGWRGRRNGFNPRASRGVFSSFCCLPLATGPDLSRWGSRVTVRRSGVSSQSRPEGDPRAGPGWRRTLGRGFPAVPLVLGLFLGRGFAGAQVPPGPDPGVREGTAPPSMGEAFRVRLERARRALREEGGKGFLRHLRAAGIYGIEDPSWIRLRVEAARRERDPDARTLESRLLVLAAMDARGRFVLPRELKKGWPEAEADPRPLAAARVAAVRELHRFAVKCAKKGKAVPGGGLLLRFSADLAEILFDGAPALRRYYGPKFRELMENHRPAYAKVLDPLRALAGGGGKGAATTGRDLRLQAALRLAGFAAQAGFKFLKGPKPPRMEALAKAGREARERLRRALAARIGEPWTEEPLAALDPTERRAFTESHADWSNPGVAVSPGGLYRIETICGFETLLGTVRTIEKHHTRLARWFGRDPFKSRRGTVRIVPEAADLESEDAPFWWVGGFQAGDRTVLRFSWGSIAGLGRSLTHELTHRFDGAIHPALPAWLAEGRAVYTAAAYGPIEDGDFEPRYLNPWKVQTPFIKGYGGEAKFRKLIEGTIEDYRDNYSAGYALYTFLNTWEIDGKAVFARKLGGFLRARPARKKEPFKAFLATFADGEGGRPDGKKEFLKLWRSFLVGCYRHCWGEKVPWIARYVLRLAPSRRNARIEDRPTWTWTRNRAEPWFGDRQAALAGKLLLAAGKLEAAAEAFCWALAVDGWRAEGAEALPGLLRRLGRSGAAWVLEKERARRGLGSEPRGRFPLFDRLPRLTAYLRSLDRTAESLASLGLASSAARLRGDARRLRRATGAKTGPLEEEPVPLDPRGLPHHLGLHGWVEDGLSGYEERRVRGLWYVTPGGDLHVGRFRPRDATGTLDRRAHQRHAFVRSAEWQAPGSYRFETTVHFTTSFVSGALILGNERRDRNLRLYFSAGDFLYSVGRKDEPGKTKACSFSLRGLWDREGPLPGGRPRTRFRFEKPSSFFRLEVRIHGPTARVYVEGKHILSYTTPDLRPLEGTIGLAMSQGAVRLQEPTVQRLDAGREAPPLPREAFGLDLGGKGAGPSVLAGVLGLPCRGLVPGKQGTVVCLLPEKGVRKREKDPSLEKPAPPMLLYRQLRKAVQALRGDLLRFPQDLVFFVPASLEEEARLAIESEHRAFFGRKAPLRTRAVTIPPLEKRPWLLFVDPFGVVRAAGRVGPGGGLPAAIRTLCAFTRRPRGSQ